MLFLYNAKTADSKQFVYALFTQTPQKKQRLTIARKPL